MKKILSLVAMALFSVAGYGQTAAAPTFSIPSGTAGAGTVTVTTSTTNAKVFCTTDGSQPDYTSYYTGPITIPAGGMTLKCISGLVISTTGPAPTYETNALTGPGSSNWKGVNNNATGNANNVTNPTGSDCPSGWNCSGTGLTTSGCLNGGTAVSGLGTTYTVPSHNAGAGPCMTFTFAAADTSSQVNVLWARHGLSTCGDLCTWVVADSWVYYPSGNNSHTTYEHDSQILVGTLGPHGYNYQYGMQCKLCTTSSAEWQFGGTTNTNWFDMGISQQFAAGQWHHIVREDKRILSEETSKPCESEQKAGQAGLHVMLPCQYYMKIILDEKAYNLQDPSMCPSTGSHPKQATGAPAGCTIPIDYEQASWNDSSFANDQYQMDIDGFTTTNSTIVDEGTFVAYNDPSSTVTATYPGGSAPSTTVNSTMSTSAIQSAINGLTSGQTLSFLPGTYNLSSGLTLPCTGGVTYSGPNVGIVTTTNPPSAIMKESGNVYVFTAAANGTTGTITSGKGSNCNIQYFQFSGKEGGIHLTSPSSGVHVTQNMFTLNDGTPSSGSSDANANIYIGGTQGSTLGAAVGATNITVDWNLFTNECATIRASTTNNGGLCAATWVNGWNNGFTWANNTVDLIEEGLHLATNYPSSGPSANHLTVQNNNLQGNIRSMIDILQNTDGTAVVGHNAMYQPY